ncbi:hypothetical protein ACLOJK_031992 [Asimina triloba]
MGMQMRRGSMVIHELCCIAYNDAVCATSKAMPLARHVGRGIRCALGFSSSFPLLGRNQKRTEKTTNTAIGFTSPEGHLEFPAPTPFPSHLQLRTTP